MPRVILGFDTATADTAVAVSGTPGKDLRIGPEDGRPVHGRALLGAIEEAVDASGGWGMVDLIAVGIGPGSFTGLRIGISTARALAQSRRLPVAGVPTTTALLAGIDVAVEDADATRLAVVDARRGEVFASAQLAAAGATASEPVVCTPDAVARQLGRGDLVGAVAVGDGSLRFRAEIESAGARVPPDDDPAHRVSALRICELGATMDGAGAELIRPTYLRRPDAERWRERDGRN